MDKVEVEVELEGQGVATTVEAASSTVESIVEAIRNAVDIGEPVYLFEKGSEKELTDIGKRTAICVVAHRCKKVEVSVQFEHGTKSREFSPAARLYDVVNWAVGKKGFNLDNTARAKANLMLSGDDKQPLDKDTPVGRYTTEGTCSAAFILTLKDFTNG